jgi:UDP-N-acetylglucosamine diphosphorylase/glucosamine-1-phosphate N-acetyltransferase
MNIALFEDGNYTRLLPLTWLRMACELRCGRDRLIDKIRAHVGTRIARLYVRDETREVVEDRIDLADPVADEGWCLVNARVLATADVLTPPTGVAWLSQDTLVAITLPAHAIEGLSSDVFLDDSRLEEWLKSFRAETAPSELQPIDYLWELIDANKRELQRQCTDGGVQEGRIHDGAYLVNAAEIHVEPGAVIKPGVVLDAEDGPIYIDRDVLIQPNAVVEGPCYIGIGTTIRPGAIIRGNTSIGELCKVGGEIESSIFQGCSNKQHDGFLGHSFVGEWVNLGADTVTSDLKNTYGTIRVSLNGVNVESGHHFVGSFIGDHAKTGIGTILPTGGVIGVAANVFTHSTVPKFVPSFAWLTDEGMTSYRVDKAIDIARIVMGRRERHFSDAEVELFERTARLARDVESAGWT